MADDEMPLDLTGKKKKGKKKPVVLDEVEGDEELVLPEKKPKAKEIKLPAAEEELQDEDLAPGIGRSNLLDARKEWTDYSYDDLLDMVFDIMREKNPELAAGEKKKFIMKPPQVARAGSKKTAFANFAEICRLLKRTPKHVLQFLLAELGTTGSIDGNQCLIVKGRFQQKHFESVLRKYIKEYVTCHTCRGSDTELTKDTLSLLPRVQDLRKSLLGDRDQVRFHGDGRQACGSTACCRGYRGQISPKTGSSFVFLLMLHIYGYLGTE